jgi:hypothetical protein
MSTNGNGNAVASLSDDLIARAQAIASRSDELLHLLEDARGRLLDTGEKPAPQRKLKPEPTRQRKGSTSNNGIPEAAHHPDVGGRRGPRGDRGATA